MERLTLHDFHLGLGARFATVNRAEVVADYGGVLTEYAALRESAGILDLGFRGRICLTGSDRVRFLHGQVTNDVNGLHPGEGCYAALITAKGRMESDLNIYCLQDELLLDFEPGLTPTVSQRLEKYIIADDVQVVDVAPHYGLFSVQGPNAQAVVRALGLPGDVPPEPFSFVKLADETLGELYLVNQPRAGVPGYDLFVPTAALPRAADKLFGAARSVRALPCGWQALEMVRIEAGIPRFGQDIDDTNLPLEAGLESRAISLAKGCYVGQEVISRIRTYSQVAKAWRGLRLAADLEALPVRGDKLIHDGKEAGYVTSALASPALKANIALGYVRKEVNQIGTELALRTAAGDTPVRIVELPFNL